MEKLICYKTADMMLFNNYDKALEHEELLNAVVKEATDKIKFFDKEFKEIPVTVDSYFDAVGSFDEAYSFCDKVVILDRLSDKLQEYITFSHSLQFPSAPGVYKLNDDCKWELVK